MGYGEEISTNGKIKRDGLSLRSHLFRRAIHLAIVLVVMYYLFPEPFIYLPRKLWAFALFGIFPLLLEWYRLKNKMLFFGQRSHESNMPGSYLWALWAALIMILILPQSIVVPVIMIFAISDPLLGEIRFWKKELVFPLGWAMITVFFLLFGYHPILAIVGGLAMVVGESIDVIGEIWLREDSFGFLKRGLGVVKFAIPFKTDDDFTTQFVPGMVLGLLYLFVPSLFPGPYFSSIPL